MKNPGNDVTDATVKVLLVEDDEDDYILVKNLLEEVNSPKFELKWVASDEGALQDMCSGRYDVCLVDYRFGSRSGLDLMADAKSKGMKCPAILLTGYGDHDVDIQAMKAGAADYLEKSLITPALLEKSIRYAMANARTTIALQNLSRRILSAQEDERKHVARELHDSIGSSLTAIKMGLESKLEAMRKGKDAAKGIRLEDVIRLVQDTIKETRRMQQALRPPIIDDLGIVVAIRSLCRDFSKFYPDIQMQYSFDIQEEEIPEPLKIVIYRVCQEAFNNIVKHSSATSACMILRKSEGRIELSIEDNGHGFDPEELHAGHDIRGEMGLASMKERSEVSGGSFSLRSSKSEGTLIIVSWPAGASTAPSLSEVLAWPSQPKKCC
jgi:signal transduction histidine kinase